MEYRTERIAGALLFLAVTQFVLGLIISEALFPSYSISVNYISDLGVGPSSMIFNSSVFLLGLLLLIGSYFLQRAFDFKILTAALVLTAIGAMGVGIFTENFETLHPIVSLIAFVFGGLSAISSGISSFIHKPRLVSPVFSAFAIVLGLMTLGALVLFAGRIYFGLGVGGMERMIAYPMLMWGAEFGGYLMTQSEKSTTHEKPQ